MSNGVASSSGTTRIQAYRIVKRKFLSTAFSGEGARLYGGRWNSPGVAVVYTSSALSLAILEWRCHLSQWPAPPAVIIEIEFDASRSGRRLNCQRTGGATRPLNRTRPWAITGCTLGDQPS
jgi:hypothetical protein